MQPQDAGGSFEWGHVMSAFGGGIITAMGAAIGWIYNAGGKRPSLKIEFQKSLSEAEERIEAKIDIAEKNAESKVDDMAEKFQESFNGIRRQIDDNRLHTSENYVRKEDFREFRDEYREDMRDLKSNIAKILGDKAG
jgi:hypothetical protein